MHCYNCGHPFEEGDHFCRFCGAPLNIPPQQKKGSRWVPILIMILLCTIGIGMFFFMPYSGSPASEPDALSWFSVDNGILYFDKAHYSGSSELVIPSQFDGQTILALSDGCFENCEMLTSVELPDTLESIGKGAFRNCTALRGIKIPESVKRIGIEAFYGCSAMEAVSLTDSLEYIGPGAFGECNRLYYILFSGAHQDWIELYDEFITPYTGVFCDEGSFYQGKPNS